MLGLYVEIQGSGFDNIIAWSETIIKDVNAGKLIDSATSVLLTRVQNRFRKEENPDGSKWRPTKAALRRARGIPTRGSDGVMRTGGSTYLVSGNLYRSLQVSRETGTQGRVFSDYYVAGALQDWQGRDFMGCNDDDLLAMMRAIEKELFRGFS